MGDEILGENLNQISRYIDYHEKGYFIHEFRNIKSANFIFFVASPLARGNYEIVMISVVIIDEDIDPRSYFHLLKQFVAECKQIDDVYKGFHLEIGQNSSSQDVYEKIKELMHKMVLYLNDISLLKYI